MSLFRPMGNTQKMAVVASTNAIELLDTYDAASRTIRIFNDSDNLVFVAFGGSDVVAAVPSSGSGANGVPLAANRETGFELPGDSSASHMAAICEAGQTAVLYVTIGAGT